MFRRHTVKLYPNDFVKAKFELWERHCRWLWNLCLQQRLDAWSKKKYPDYYQQTKQLAELKQELNWLFEVPSQMLQHVLSDLDKASKQMFEKVTQQPHFKKRNTYSSSVEMYVHAKSQQITNGYLKIPKIGPVRFRGLKKQPGNLKSFNLIKRAGDWYASLLFEREDRVNENASIVGIDRGITSLFAFSDGTNGSALGCTSLIDNPRWYRSSEQKLKHAQRSLSRKKKGSTRRKKQQLRLAKLHQHVSNQRKDFLHKLSTSISKNHGIVVLEDLKIENMVKFSSGMAKSIQDVGWGMFCNMLEYKCREVIKVNPAYTSQTCSKCGHLDRENRCGKRFECMKCGYQADADLNAAENILAAGQAVVARRGYLFKNPLKRETSKGSMTRGVPLVH